MKEKCRFFITTKRGVGCSNKRAWRYYGYESMDNEVALLGDDDDHCAVGRRDCPFYVGGFIYSDKTSLDEILGL